MPCAYYDTIGRKHSNPTLENPYRWEDSTIVHNAIESSKRRIEELDVIISRIYEDNILGKLSDERYMRMSAGYEKEQKDLIQTIANSEQRLKEMEQTSVDLKLLLTTLREANDITELNQTLVNKLIRRIEVHGNEKSTAEAE